MGKKRDNLENIEIMDWGESELDEGVLTGPEATAETEQVRLQWAGPVLSFILLFFSLCNVISSNFTGPLCP